MIQNEGLCAWTQNCGSERLHRPEYATLVLENTDAAILLIASNEEYKILYASETLRTAIRETLIRDKLDNNETRQIPLFKIRGLASTLLETN